MSLHTYRVTDKSRTEIKMRMKTANVTNKKLTGATFTPPQLANYLSDKIICHCNDLTNKTILDPACGNGALLSSIANKTNLKSGKILGFDTNDEYVKQTQKNLKELNINNFQIEKKDFLETTANRANEPDKTIIEYADIIIANPPYVRTQILGAEKTRQMAKDYHLSGRVDLYYPFLIEMTKVLKNDGLLGVITSNRYLTTKSGADIRKFLIDNYNILEVIDLGDSQLFNASVLPAIFIGRKKKADNQQQTPCNFAKIYESTLRDEKAEKADSIYDILTKNRGGSYTVGEKTYNFSTGILTLPVNKTDIWKMTTGTENEFIEKIQRNTFCHVGDKLKVRVGIKSCADNIFLNPDLGKENIESEQELVKPMISRENIKRWNCSVSDLSKVLYPHYEKDGKRFVYDINYYPIVKRYLLKHKEQLDSRSYLISANRKWYEMWVPQNPKLWNMPKIVFPDISIDARFSYDESGAIVNGNCYWIAAQTEDEKNLILLIQGIANSDLMSKYHDLCFNNKLYSGRRRYLSQYVEQYPIPNPSSIYSKQIVEITKQLNSSLEPLENHSLIRELNKNVNYAFGFMD